MKEMKKLSIVWGVILVLIFGMLTTFGILYTKKVKPYKDMEKLLVDQTKKYVELEFSYPQNGEKLNVTLEQLQGKELVEELKHNDEACDGYVTIGKNGVAYEYKGYVKCTNYTTKGYQED